MRPAVGRVRSAMRTSKKPSRRSPSVPHVLCSSIPPIASAPPTTNPATRCSECSYPEATRSTASRSYRAEWHSVSRISCPWTTAPATPKTTCARASRTPSVDAPQSGSCTAWSTGAEDDLHQVTEIARRMVLRWGMSEKLGTISFVTPQDEGLPPAFQHQPYSEATSELIDAEVRRIVEECHREA